MDVTSRRPPTEIQYAWYASMNHNEYFIFGMPCLDKQMVPLLVDSSAAGPRSHINI